MRTLIVLLLLTGCVLAEDAWDAAELDLEALQAALEKAKEQKDRPDAQDRAELLSDLIATLTARADLPDVSTAKERLAAAEQKQKALEEAPTETDLPPIEQDADFEKIKSAWDAAKSAQKAEAEALDHVSSRISALESEAKKLPEILADSRRRLSAAAEGTDSYLLATLKLRVRAGEERQSFITSALEAYRAEKPVATTRLEVAKIGEGRTRREYEAAAAEYSAMLNRQADAKKEAARLKAEEAARSGDPLHKFKTKVEESIVKLDTDSGILKSKLPKWETLVAAEERALTRFERLAKSLDSDGVKTSLSPETANLLRLTRTTLMSRERLLSGSRIPQLKQAQARNQTALAELQQEMLRNEEPPEESAQFRELVKALGPAREGEALALWEKMVSGRLASAARAQASVLDLLEAKQSQLGELYDRQRAVVETLIDRISSELYFVRSNESLGLATLREALDDLKKLAMDVKAGADRTLGQELLLLVGLGLFVGVAAPLLISVLKKHLRLAPDQPVKPGVMNMFFRLLRLALLASLLPLVFLLLAAALGAVEEQGHLETAVRVWLRLAALSFFILGFLRELFREEGPLVTRWKLSGDVAAQILVSVRIFLFAYTFLVFPAEIGRDLYQVDALPRLLETAFYGFMFWAMYRLVLRRRPLIRRWIGASGTLYRLWILIGPAIGALLLAIVALDVAGYRVGARYLFKGALRSYGVILFLALAYRLFAKGFRRLVDRSLAAQQTEGAERRVVSETVMQQLTRVMGFILVLVTGFVLGDAWEFGGYLTGFMNNLVLGQFHDGTVLTLLDVLTAALWVVGAHFVVHNLSGVLEFLVFPLIEEGEKGGRYVLLTLSRYAILLIGYSAAFLALNFNFQSLSVVIAAFSVGIGFGLQEIIGNFISGLILLIERPVRVGDTITVGTTGGSVEKITIRATVVTSWDNQQIIVPNKNFITQNVTNWTRNNDITRRKIPVSLAQGTDIDRARVIMEEVLKSTPGVLEEPAPKVLFQNFGESQLDFELWFHCSISVGFGLMTQVRFEVNRRFREEGIELAVPRRRIETLEVSADTERR